MDKVKWSLINSSDGSFIDENGLLQVALHESENELTVVAENNKEQAFSKVNVKPHKVYMAVPFSEGEMIQGLANRNAYVNIKKYRNNVMINEQEVRADGVEGKFSLDYIGLTTKLNDRIVVKQRVGGYGLWSDEVETLIVQGHVPTIDIKVVNSKLSLYINSRNNGNVIITDNEGNVENGKLDSTGVLIYPIKPKLTTLYYDIDIKGDDWEYIKQRVSLKECNSVVDKVEGVNTYHSIHGYPGMRYGWYYKGEEKPYNSHIISSTGVQNLKTPTKGSKYENKFYYDNNDLNSYFRVVEITI